MDKSKKYQVLSIRYSEISLPKNQGKSPKQKNVERVFIAEDKERLMRKLRSFEKSILHRKKSGVGLFARLRMQIECFAKKCQRFHIETLQL